MDKGNWVPLDKRLVSFLPKIADNRPYTKLEAMFSLSVDYDNSISVSIAGYARLWKWNRNTVTRFFKAIGVEISYPDSTSKKQNQRGQICIQIRDRSGTDQGQIRIIDNSDLTKEKIRSGTDKEQIGSRSVSATIYPNPNPDPKPKKNKCNPLTNRQKFLDNIPDSIKIKYPNANYESITDDIIDYCQRMGKTYKDYYAAMRTFIKNNINKNPSLDNGKSAAQKSIEETNTYINS